MESVFSRLNAINVNDHTEKKNGLTYLSWAWAWAEVKKLFPGAAYTIYERDTEFGPVNYFTDGRTCWVKTGVNIDGLEHIEELPVMDMRNRSISYDAITSMDVNKAIQRSLTKACARHGLGLYIYAGEDLPEEESDQKAAETAQKVERAKANPLDIPKTKAVAQPAMIAPGQRIFIMQHARPEEVKKLQAKYGENFERMTMEQAKGNVEYLQKRIEAAGAAS